MVSVASVDVSSLSTGTSFSVVVCCVCIKSEKGGVKSEQGVNMCEKGVG